MRQKGKWKLAVFVLLAVLISVIFFQWRSFSSEQNKKMEKANAEFSIKHQNDHFIIQQTIHHLSPRTYELIWPKDIKNLKCSSSSGKTCTWINANKSKIKLGSSNVTFTYTLNRKANKDFFVLNDWFLQLKNVPLNSIKIQLSDSDFQNGTWIAGGNRVAIKHMDFIDYYVFETKTDIPALLWNNKKLVKSKINNWLTIYNDGSTKIPVLPYEKINVFQEHPPIYIFLTSDYTSRQIGSIIVLNVKDVPKFEPMLVQSFLDKKFHFESNEELLRDIIASAVMEKPLGSKKSQELYDQLVKVFSQNDLDKWTNDIISLKKDKINDKDLDLLIQKITGLRTNFFQENNNEKSLIKSLQLFDPHIVKINGQVINMNIILNHGKRMYPLEKTMSALGYKVKTSNNGTILQIDKIKHHFQFTLNSHIFYYNNEKYGVLTYPIFTQNNKNYIEENWLKQLFKMNIQIYDKEIELFN